MYISKHYFFFFDNTLEHFPHSKTLVLLIILIDYLPLYFLSVSSILSLKGHFCNNDYNSIITTYTKISLVHYINNAFKYFKSDTFQFTFSEIIIFIVIFLICIAYILCILLSKYNWLAYIISKKQSNRHDVKTVPFKEIFKQALKKVIPYIFDILYFRILSFYIIYLLLYPIIFLLHSNNYMFFIVTIEIVLYLLSCMFYYTYTKVIIKLDNNITNYPFDGFSSQYDISMLLGKVCFGISVNYRILSTLVPNNLNYPNIEYLFTILGFLVLIYYILSTIVLFMRDNSYIFFYTNARYNYFRMTLIVFNFISLIVHSFFDSFSMIAMNVIGHCAIAACSIILIIYISKLRFKRILFSSKDNPNLLLYVFDQLIFHQNNDINDFSREMLLSQYKKCSCQDNDKCDICQLFDSIDKEEKVSNEKYSTQIISILYKNLPKYDKDFKKSLAKLIYSFKKTQLNYFYFSKKFHKYITLYENEEPTIALELMVLYKYLVNQHYNEVTVQVKMIKDSQILIEKMQSFLELLSETLFMNDNDPSYLIQNSLKMRLISNSFKEDLIGKHESNITYQTVVIKYILECAINKTIKSTNNTIFNIAYYDEFLLDHYTNDKQLTISYNIEKKKLTIIKAGSDFCSLVGHNLRELFFFNDYIFDSLNSLIKGIREESNTTSIDFPVKDFTHGDNYISSCKMKLMILPTIDLTECLFLAIYQINTENIIVTTHNAKNEEIIVTYNYQLSKYLIFPPTVMQLLEATSRSFLFDSILKEKEKENENSHTYYMFTFLNYLKTFGKYIKFLSESNFEGEKDKEKLEQILKHYDKLIKDSKSSKIKYKSIKLLSKKAYINNQLSRPILIYSFPSEEKIGTAKKFSLNINTNSVSLVDFGNFTSQGTTGTNTALMSGLIANSNSSMIYSKSTEGQSSYYQGNPELMKLFLEEKKKKIEQHRHFTCFTYLIFLSNIFLITLSIVYLVIELSSNAQFKSNVDFFNTYVKFEKYFMGDMLDLIFMQCPSKTGSLECTPFFITLSETYKNRYNFSNDFQLYEYFIYDMKIRADTSSTLFGTLKKEIMASNHKAFSELVNSNFEYKYLSIVGESGLEVKVKNYTYIDSLSMFLTTLNDVINSEHFMKVPIYFIDIKGSSIEGINLTSITLIKGYESNQMGQYNILLNCRKYFSLFNVFHDEVEDTLRSNIKSNKRIVIFFTFLLIGLHFILLLICLSLIIVFKEILLFHFEDIFSNLQKKDVQNFLHLKIEALKMLSHLYKVNPNTLISKVENIKRDYSRSIKEKLSKKDDVDKTPVAKKKVPKEHQFLVQQTSDYILSSSVSALYYIFIIFIIITMVYFVFLLSTLNDYLTIMTSQIQNSHIDSLIVSMSVTFEFMLKTNQSDIDMFAYSNLEQAPGSGGFVQDKLNLIYQRIRYVQSSESDHQNKIKRFSDVVDLSCKNIIPISMGNVGKTIVSKYMPDKDVVNNLVLLCESFDFMRFKDDKLLIKDIIYKLNYFLSLFNANTLDRNFALGKTEPVFNLFVEVLVLFRNIRNYESSTLFPTFLDNVNHKYNLLIYSYLILIIVFEISLFIGLRLFVIKKFMTINKGLNLLKSCTKV